MAFDESLVMVSSLSRLSICTSSAYVNEDEAATKNHPDSCVFTSLENFDGAEADGEVSDDGEGKENVRESDSDKETRGFYSLPVTPSRRRRKLTVSGELDANESNRDGGKCSLRRQKRLVREKKKKRVNGESDGGGREGLTVLTRAKGGEKSLRMGLEEVKACRDLGFELEVPVPGPGRISVSTTGSNFDTQTSSGGNSPIATWRISNPGDDPKEVKARLKVWAQAVALASATRQAS
ncbi:unnamed protein product [Arabidopsis lyrata]|uniref:uncharacterized protein LOC9312727 n=1 Tax=Arabidopsis lyrata subsp. lyrata TaxID=81972 RepID=UPI000A29B832|nr:uncharacterized protein LOC9312727 [Arabidopsis lyrata subsp. lyrata]CAH8269467.1 unnamed protein product [Arabidopsis lyrata]|eukprot:XP_020882094.1 uncharacterized protein LOC9312727 [Arabidopsis lyrata subsp. lyrata]